MRSQPRRSPEDANAGRAFALERIAAATLATFRAPTKQTVSQWADAERVLSSEASAEPGRWDTERTPYLREIMDAMNDPTVTRVVCCKSAQVGFTEMLGNIVGYFIDVDPSPMLCVMPTIELAESWSKDRLAPMLRDSPALARKVAAPMSRDASNTLRSKVFPGGRLNVVGANAASGLASRPIRVVLFDECDRYPTSAGTEGDPIALASQRQKTFWSRKTLIGSTPTLKGTSVVWREYETSNMKKFFVPCGDCGHSQVLAWSNVRWDKTADGRHQPSTAHYVCENCGSVWDDAARYDAVARGSWRATNPDGAPGTAGYHINILMSPWTVLADVVAEFLAARNDAALLQVWTNTSLGMPFEESREKIESASLLSRGENYSELSIPLGVKFLTCGIDTQGDRLEAQIIGWGLHEEAWSVLYRVIPGDPAQRHVWTLLDEVLRQPYFREDGLEMRVKASAIDCGGHHQHSVLSYCSTRRSVLPIKGASGPKPVWPPRASKTRDNRRIYIVGVSTAKDVIYSRLRLNEVGAGTMHFPIGGAYDAEYFAQLTAEQVQTRHREGRPERHWILPPGKRNEVLDTWVYALAARTALPYRLDVVRKPNGMTRPAPVQMMLRDPDSGKAEPTSTPPAASPVTPPTTPPPTPATNRPFRVRNVVRSRFLMR